MAASQGCSRREAFHPPDANSGSSDAKALPFHPSSEHVADDETRPAVPLESKPGAPFHAAGNARTLPSGTLLTVSLDKSFSVAGTRPGDTFTATLTGPIMVDGNILVERGVQVSGVVESVQPPKTRAGRADPGLLRLSLRTIGVDGRSITLQTSSLFARWGSPAAAAIIPVSKPRSTDYQLLKGHHLTFRLTAPAALTDTNSLAERRSPEPGK